MAYFLSLLGKEGVVVQTLRPMGKVQIGNKLYECRCEHGTIEKDLPVVVVHSNPLTVERKLTF